MAEPGQASFGAHVNLLQLFLDRRGPIVERIQAILNAPEKPSAFQQDRPALSRQFDDCFFGLPGLSRDQQGLRGALQRAHWADGFQPRVMPGIPNEMFDPGDLMARAFTMWRHTRWPGRNGRLRCAQTLFNVFVVRCLALLDMRLCDEGEGAAARLRQLQDILSSLWHSSPPDQPELVRDVRWLVPVAQSPTTDDLAPYFVAAGRFEACLPPDDQLVIHRASVLMAGGHLRSQLKHFQMQGRSLDEKDLILSTRSSNALDCAMTIQHLAPLLAAYAEAIEQGDAGKRSQLAGVICQGLSPDPELFVDRLDLLRAYSMIEHLFITADEGGTPMLTPMGQRHVRLVDQYVALMTRLGPSLLEDHRQFRPEPGSYSPYGVMYGFSSNIIEHMAIKALQPDAETRFSLEDVFAEEGARTERLAWVSAWRQLPHVPQEVRRLYEYPQSFAEEIFARLARTLGHQAGDRRGTSSACGRLRVGSPDAAPLAAHLFQSSDPALVAAGKATACDAQQLAANRNEGMYLVSYPTSGGWAAISKDVLTDVLGAGRDASVPDLPASAAQALNIMCCGLLAADR